MKFISTKQRLPSIGDYYYVKIDTKQDSILRTICEWSEYPNGNYDWDFKGIQHFPGLKEDAEVVEWLDEDLNEVGVLLEGEHPDEINPRANTWLEERRNWQAEVERLRLIINGQ